MRLRLRGGILGVAAFAAPLAAQSPPPLDKTELIRLLTNPLFAQTEVADVVRRSCLTFRPTERDWADLRNAGPATVADRKSTRLNSSHSQISYAVFCLKKKKKKQSHTYLQ